jgi:hypothetical protein
LSRAGVMGQLKEIQYYIFILIPNTLAQLAYCSFRKPKKRENLSSGPFFNTPHYFYERVQWSLLIKLPRTPDQDAILHQLQPFFELR